jgi:hypothetical protein
MGKNTNFLEYIRTITKTVLYNYLFFKNFSYIFSDEDIISFNNNNSHGRKIPHLFYSSSSSIIKHPKYEDRFILNIRCVNYKLLKNTKPSFDMTNNVSFTINHILILDNYFNIIGRFINKPEISKNIYVGIEDIRLFNFQNKIYYIGCIYNPGTNSIEISSNEYIIGKNYKINTIKPSFITDNKNEKNWVFFENNDEMLTIYKWYPIYVCKIDYESKYLNLIKKIYTPKIFKKFRGSTNGVLWNDKFWFIVHKQNNFNNIKYYTHNFVVLNRDLTVYGYTDIFNFENYLVEFCIGMTTRNNNFIITYSTLDSTSKLCVLSCQLINNILIKV